MRGSPIVTLSEVYIGLIKLFQRSSDFSVPPLDTRHYHLCPPGILCAPDCTMTPNFLLNICTQESLLRFQSLHLSTFYRSHCLDEIFSQPFVTSTMSSTKLGRMVNLHLPSLEVMYGDCLTVISNFAT